MDTLKASPPHLLILCLEGKLTAEQFDAVAAQVDDALERNEIINLFCDLTRLDGITPMALLKDLLYGMSTLGKTYRFHRIAVVTDNPSLEEVLHFEDRIFSEISIKSFASRDRAAALAWSEASIELPPPGIQVIEFAEQNYLQVDVGEEVTGFDMRHLQEVIRQRYARHGPVNLLVQASKQPRLGPGLLYEKLKGLDVLGLVAKYAVVAPRWAKARVIALNSVVNTRLHYFPAEEAGRALSWLIDAAPAVQLVPCKLPRVVGLRMTGKITDQEVKGFYHLVLPQIKEDKGIDILLEVPGDEGFSLMGLLEAMKSGLQHFSEVTRGVRRMALITDSRWLSKVVELENLLLPGMEERPFSFAQRDLAKAWLSEGRARPEA